MLQFFKNSMLFSSETFSNKTWLALSQVLNEKILRGWLWYIFSNWAGLTISCCYGEIIKPLVHNHYEIGVSLRRHNKPQSNATILKSNIQFKANQGFKRDTIHYGAENLSAIIVAGSKKV